MEGQGYSVRNQYQYKTWANAEILEAIGRIDPSTNPDQRKLAVRLLNHTYVVDRIFAAHLSGEQHTYQATNTHETPTLDQLVKRISDSDKWYEHYVSHLPELHLEERISFSFTDGDKGSMTRQEILFHLLAHGAYHRGNIGMVLSECGIDRPRDTFTRFLHLADAHRRAQT